MANKPTQASFPIPTTPIQDEQGNLHWAWLQWFQNLNQAVGGTLPASSAAQFQVTEVANQLQVHSNGKVIGTIAVTP